MSRLAAVPTKTSLRKLPKGELEERLQELGLDTSGNKEALVGRLLSYLTAGALMQSAAAADEQQVRAAWAALPCKYGSQCALLQEPRKLCSCMLRPANIKVLLPAAGACWWRGRGAARPGAAPGGGAARCIAAPHGRRCRAPGGAVMPLALYASVARFHNLGPVSLPQTGCLSNHASLDLLRCVGGSL